MTEEEIIKQKLLKMDEQYYKKHFLESENVEEFIQEEFEKIGKKFMRVYIRAFFLESSIAKMPIKSQKIEKIFKRLNIICSLFEYLNDCYIESFKWFLLYAC